MLARTVAQSRLTFRIVRKRAWRLFKCRPGRRIHISNQETDS